MDDHTAEAPAARNRATGRRGWRAVAALLLGAVAASSLLIRLPAAFRGMDDQAKKNSGTDAPHRILAAADSLDIDNDFVTAAPSVLPPDASYAVLLPPSPEVAASSYGIGQITLDGLPGFLQYLLLPRRQVPPDQAQYVLCYACDTDPWDHRTSWLWKNDHAVAIGKVNR
jgi:hypothetical protein